MFVSFETPSSMPPWSLAADRSTSTTFHPNRQVVSKRPHPRLSRSPKPLQIGLTPTCQASRIPKTACTPSCWQSLKRRCLGRFFNRLVETEPRPPKSSAFTEERCVTNCGRTESTSQRSRVSPLATNRCSAGRNRFGGIDLGGHRFRFGDLDLGRFGIDLGG